MVISDWNILARDRGLGDQPGTGRSRHYQGQWLIFEKPASPPTEEGLPYLGHSGASLATADGRVVQEVIATSLCLLRVSHSPVEAMPDVHLSREVCTGTVLATRKQLYPQAVGSYIGCGMAAIRFNCPARR
jgi:hypothetical protein